MLHVVERSYVLSPHIGLDATDMRLFFIVQLVVRIEGVALAQGQIAADTEGLLIAFRIASLIIVEVEMAVGRHDHVVAHLGSGDAAFGTAPRHDRRALRDAAVEDLVPADDLAAFFRQVFLDRRDEVTLEFRLAGEALLFHQGLAFRAFLPFLARGFVAADVDVFRREDVADLVEHAFEEGHGLGVAGAEDFGEDTPGRLDFIWIFRAAAAQFGIARQGGGGVARHLDFRDDGDVVTGRILHDFAHLVLGVEAAVGRAVILVGAIVAYQGLGPHGAYFRQLGILLDLGAPTLVFRQVPVEHVEFVQGHHRDEGLDLVDREEMPATVQMRTAVRERGLVLDQHTGDMSVALGEDLRKGLLAPVDAGLGAARDDDLALARVEHVFLGGEFRVEARGDLGHRAVGGHFHAAAAVLQGDGIGNDLEADGRVAAAAGNQRREQGTGQQDLGECFHGIRCIIAKVRNSCSASQILRCQAPARRRARTRAQRRRNAAPAAP